MQKRTISEEHRLNLRLSHLGKKLSPATRLKMSLAQRAKPNSGRFKPKFTPWNKGVTGYKMPPCSQERKIKIGLANAIALKGKKQSIETRLKRSLAFKGQRNHQWRGGKTQSNLVIRNSIEARLWREAVFARDNWTCLFCNERGGKLNADHIKPFSLFPNLRFAIDNGRTLCVPCHREVTRQQQKDNLFPNAVATRFQKKSPQEGQPVNSGIIPSPQNAAMQNA